MRIFVIWVVVFMLAIGSIQEMYGGNSARKSGPGKLSSLNLSFASSNTRVAGRSTVQDQPADQLVITPWRGPIQPLNIQPTDPIPVVTRIPTTEPVVFVGIDDGWIQSSEAQDWLISHHLPFTLFLTDNGIKNNYNYFAQLQAAGMAIQDHTLSHPHMPKLNLDQQKTEICATADTYQRVFGRRPTLFRPPYGELNDDTRQAATACGMKALVLWHVVIGTGGDVQFQVGSNHLQPGDIILMHFRPEFLADIEALTKEVKQNHLQIGRLEDWLP